VLEDAEISIVERDGGEPSQRAALLQPADEVDEWNDLIVAGQPPHLAPEGIHVEVQAGLALGCGSVSVHDVVVTEDDARITQAACERGQSDGTKASIQETRQH